MCEEKGREACRGYRSAEGRRLIRGGACRGTHQRTDQLREMPLIRGGEVDQAKARVTGSFFNIETAAFVIYVFVPPMPT